MLTSLSTAPWVLQVLAASSLQETAAGDVNLVTALPTVISNMHDYFVATAAKLERTHAEVRRSFAAARMCRDCCAREDNILVCGGGCHARRCSAANARVLSFVCFA